MEEAAAFESFAVFLLPSGSFLYLDLNLGPTLSFSSFLQATRVEISSRYHDRLLLNSLLHLLPTHVSGKTLETFYSNYPKILSISSCWLYLDIQEFFS